MFHVLEGEIEVTIFAEFAEHLPSRTSPAPNRTEGQLGERMRKAIELAPKYHIELL